MPLDKYTLNWVKRLGDDKVNKSLKSINSSFSKITTGLFNEIQKLILEKLNAGADYKVSFAKCAKAMRLPSKPLEAEFIVWRQEQLNELHKTIFRNRNDFERLGIQEA